MKLSVAPSSFDTAISSRWVSTCRRIVLKTTAITTTPSVRASSSSAAPSPRVVVTELAVSPEDEGEHAVSPTRSNTSDASGGGAGQEPQPWLVLPLFAVLASASIGLLSFLDTSSSTEDVRSLPILMQCGLHLL